MTDKNSKKSLAAGKLAGATQSAPVTSRRRILVVEEDSEVRLLYADALRDRITTSILCRGRLACWTRPKPRPTTF